MANYNFLKPQTDCIKYPIVTEKSAGLFEKNQYTFIVDKNCDKIMIKKTIEFLFNVKVIKVNTCLLPRKKKRTRIELARNKHKKVIVKLSKENTINLFSDV